MRMLSVKCPNPDCSGARLLIIETRYSGDGQHRRRRYKCPACDSRYTTMETIVRRDLSPSRTAC